MTTTRNWKLLAAFAFLLVFALPARAADLIRLIVKEDRATCTGVAPQTCFQVKYKNSTDWEFFYESIDGFRYEEGYRYTLNVYRTRRKNVPADASIYSYKLKNIVKKEWIGSAAASGVAAFADQQWVLTAINGRKVANSRVFLYIDTKENRFSGSDGCNGYGGGFTYNERSRIITLGDAMSTLKACADRAVMQLANEYGQALQQKEFTTKVTNHTLTLSRKGKVVLEFIPAPLTGGTTGKNNSTDIWSYIAKHQWRLIQMNGKTQDQSPAFIDFNVQENKVSGNAGCNRFFGSYTAKDQSITFSQMGSTRMACMDPKRSKTEQELLQLLGNQTYSFDVADQTLNLYQNNRIVLMFGKFSAGKPEGSGLRGTVRFLEGNQMPGTGPRTGSNKPVAREILIYEKTRQNQVTAGEAGFFDSRSIATKKIATIKSGTDGRYNVKLPAGTYSVFVMENGRLYANGTDGEGYIQTVTIAPDAFTDFDININYKAAY
ncbi:META domain-containing protein [Taibaiella chishuiensis]|uniref:Heat shock protein HslJ n=1 Tax=Taibaiella chishuiensis TaxID=1434707 RepID=A0A2P8CV87_9BACT|nr:META domain-containing protein [Taibaiella chishuiensis]PSK88878.1 heat shock protein HslJ [Taibaiella chishuiensis]